MRAFAAILMFVCVAAVAFSQTGPAANPGTSNAAPSSNPQTIGAIGAPIQPPGPVVVPDWARYRFFFLHLADLDKLAAEKEARGKDGSKWRTHAQRASGLSESEGTILKQVAFDCNQAVSEISAQMDALDADFRAQQASGQHPVYPTAQRKALAEQKIQIINAHIDQLHVMLGDESFQKVDAYLKRTQKVAVKTPAAGTVAQGSAQ